MSIVNRDQFDPTKYRAYILKIAKRYNQDEETTKDLEQEGYIAIWHASKLYDGKGSWWAYISTAIRNRMNSFLKLNSNTIRTPSKMIGQENLIKTVSTNTPVDENGAILEDFIANEVEEDQTHIECLRMAINALTDEDDRNLIMDHYFEKMTLNELGQKHGVVRETIRLRLNKIKKVLKKNYETITRLSERN